ncbi:PEP-CTERM sorting domain-containing protein [Parasulfuritortus cantonensis]|uniref:PEP-CTERM sorting domain-containing protein n=1 Tax=Parasulfuritortus cantonensis TaxID=2528202 RepID=A0A4V2NW10_9PROT|nr:PEP-CTERM sorting domain-containing protein [Parasulfuritortus cantonensis]TCJ15552.1 PEP-CTERM sorting domain-containing protein [Parasulfuritortus cantonensis]
MNTRRLPALPLGALLAGLAAPAAASVIDFDSLATVTGNPYVAVGKPYVEDGYSLTTVAGVSFSYAGGTLYATTDANANWTGSPGVYSGVVANYGSAFLLERVDGASFDLVSMDAASFWTVSAGRQFDVYGYLAGGGYVHQSFLLDDSTATLQTLTFDAGFTGLDKIIFSSVNAQVDNIDLHVSAVPEPAGLALLLPGLGLVGVAARRRKAA